MKSCSPPVKRPRGERLFGAEDTESETQRAQRFLKSWEKEKQKFFLNRNSGCGTFVVQRKTLRPHSRQGEEAKSF
jgi:hypothetical protein